MSFGGGVHPSKIHGFHLLDPCHLTDLLADQCLRYLVDCDQMNNLPTLSSVIRGVSLPLPPSAYTNLCTLCPPVSAFTACSYRSYCPTPTIAIKHQWDSLFQTARSDDAPMGGAHYPDLQTRDPFTSTIDTLH
ncbi:hypothetical protein NHX12_002142 [Muraenolepis orangiensis]|uniref:Uncharacterized protein n=1 Tax=Muraenolepis orangiensis TaxID=630683 RepID=A0A9Q0E5Z8_9TELE|nr:hypothetical protein NHX12_002142 [Muraenolepis orangiensis]